MRTILVRHPVNPSPLQLGFRVTRQGVVLVVMNPDRLPPNGAIVMSESDAREIANNLWAAADAHEALSRRAG